MPGMNKELKGAIADANSDSQRERALREKLEYYIRRYYDELAARIELQVEYDEIADIADRQRVALMTSRILSTVALALALISLLC